MMFDSEEQAFTEWAKSMPDNCIFLVDTYNSIQGIRNAIREGLDLRKRGHSIVGIRLDSGDLAALSIEARGMLDEAGLDDAKIVASNDLDEYAIAELKQRGAKVDIWGVGTRLVTAYDEPALGGVYKLSAMRNAHGDWVDKLKLSEESRTRLRTPASSKFAAPTTATQSTTSETVARPTRVKTCSSRFSPIVWPSPWNQPGPDFNPSSRRLTATSPSLCQIH